MPTRICVTTLAKLLRDILPSVTSKDFVDKRLISDAPPARFLAELFEDSGIDSDRDQLARLIESAASQITIQGARYPEAMERMSNR